MTDDLRPDGYRWRYPMFARVTIREDMCGGGKSGAVIEREINCGEIYKVKTDDGSSYRLMVHQLRPQGSPMPDEPSTTFYFDATLPEWVALQKLAEETELSPGGVLRQALRLYQMHHQRIMDGETITYSGDEQRARDFAGTAAE